MVLSLLSAYFVKNYNIIFWGVGCEKLSWLLRCGDIGEPIADNHIEIEHIYLSIFVKVGMSAPA